MALPGQLMRQASSKNSKLHLRLLRCALAMLYRILDLYRIATHHPLSPQIPLRHRSPSAPVHQSIFHQRSLYHSPFIKFYFPLQLQQPSSFFKPHCPNDFEDRGDIDTVAQLIHRQEQKRRLEALYYRICASKRSYVTRVPERGHHEPGTSLETYVPKRGHREPATRLDTYVPKGYYRSRWQRANERLKSSLYSWYRPRRLREIIHYLNRLYDQ